MDDRRPLRRPLSLSRQFAAVTVLFVLATLGLVVGFFATNDARRSRRELTDHGRSVAEIMAQNCEFGLYTRDRETLGQLARSVDADPDVSYLVILTADRRPLAERARDGAPPPLADRDLPGLDRAEVRRIEGRGGRAGVIDILVPISGMARVTGDDLMVVEGPTTPAREVIGYLRLGLSEESLRRRLWMFLRTSALFALLVALVAVPLTSAMARRIASPVRALQAAARGISEGHLDRRIEVRGSEEVADLARAFNSVLGRFREYRSRIEGAPPGPDAAQARLEHLLVSSPGAIFSCRPGAGRGATFVSAGLIGLLGHEPVPFLESPRFWIENVHPDDRAGLEERLDAVEQRGQGDHECRMLHRDGRYRWIRTEMKLARDAEGRPKEIIGYWIDVTEHKSLEQKLLHGAFHDALTGLPNRALFLDRLRISFTRIRRQKTRLFAVLFIDLDRFKNVNDSLGHMVGDQMLVAAADRLTRCTRSGDTVARLGGDEFAMILEDLGSLDEAVGAAARIEEELSAVYELAGHEVFGTVSIGIAAAHSGYDRPEHLLRDADTAMYKAKEAGRACWVVFEESMRRQALTRIQIETDLRRALERRELGVHFQPLVDLETMEIAGFEALARWSHAVHGPVPPDQFIPAAEETGLIGPIGRFVLREACRRMTEWRRPGPGFRLGMGVNLSGKQLTPPLGAEIRALIDELRLEPGTLTLEITESAAVEHCERNFALFRELKAAGVRLVVDDFGRGYSSMLQLQWLPLDGLKIDRTFVKSMTGSGESLEIVKSILSLARNMRLDVVAEGVETADQATALKALGCRFAQGYYFFEPRDPEEIAALLAAGPRPRPREAPRGPA